LSFNGSLQRVRRAAFRSRTTPGVDRNIRRFGRVGILAVDPGRRQEPLHALHVSGRSAVALIHVTTTNPFCTRGHADLVTSAVIANGCAGGMGAVKEVVAWERRIRTANATAGMDRVVPVVVVIGVHSVPAAIMRL